MDEFVNTLFGEGMSLSHFLAMYALALMGILVSNILDIYSSGERPQGFQWSYWWSDNKVRIILSLLFAFLGILFSEQLLGAELTRFLAFTAGLTTDKTIESIKDRKKQKNRNNAPR